MEMCLRNAGIGFDAPSLGLAAGFARLATGFGGMFVGGNRESLALWSSRLPSVSVNKRTYGHFQSSAYSTLCQFD